jgi:hypothetical protein
LSANANLLSDLRYFAAGRLPYYAEFILSKGDSDRSISVLNIHAKANTGDRLESYYRRLDMAELLRETIIRNEEDWQQVLLMGDYNDDLDVSIYNELSTPYMPFLTDEERFWPVTQTLTLQGLTSMPRYDDVIDHIIATRSMEEFSFIRDGDISVHRADQYITNYESTTSDHYPVIASFTFNEASTSTQQDKSGSGLPDEFTLNPAYPNPFNPMTTLSYSMKSPQLLEITVLDVMGRNIQTLFSGIASAGEQRITFDASDLTTGLYIIQFRGRSFVKTQSVTLIR